MRILMCGSREWCNEDIIDMVINSLDINNIVIQGDCKGADKIAKRLAIYRRMEVETYPADWKKHGKKAGIVRNVEMLDSGIDLVYAFYYRKKTKGTSFTVHEAIKRGIKTIEIIEN